jgi:hypothetical protein
MRRILDDGQYGTVAEIKETNRGLFGARILFSPVRLSACKMTANDVAFHSAAAPALTAYSARSCGEIWRGPWHFIIKALRLTQQTIRCRPTQAHLHETLHIFVGFGLIRHSSIRVEQSFTANGGQKGIARRDDSSYEKNTLPSGLVSRPARRRISVSPYSPS